MRLIAFVLFTVISTSAFAKTLITQNYVIVIHNHCSEREVNCKVTYSGMSKKSGNMIKLRGRTMHSGCNDRHDRCRLTGYRFINRNFTYLVHEDGLLQVIRGRNRVLIEEQGTW